MQRLICLSLLVLFIVFTFRGTVQSDVGKLVSSEESYPISDEDTTGDSDSDSSESEDIEDVDLQITQPLSLTVIARNSQKQIQLQQQIFNSLPIEVITPPPQY